MQDKLQTDKGMIRGNTNEHVDTQEDPIQASSWQRLKGGVILWTDCGCIIERKNYPISTYMVI